MLRVIITMKNGIFVTSDFKDQTEVDNYLAYIAVNGNWGRGSHNYLVSPEVQEILYQPAQLPVFDEQGNEISPAIPEIPAVPYQAAVYEIVPAEYTVEIIDITNELKLKRIRERRNSLISEADIVVNKAYDSGSGIAAAKAYRQALRDITNAFIADMSLLDSVDPETFEFPVKP